MSDPFRLTRREDREVALAILYEADMTGDPIVDVLDRQLDDEGYSIELAQGVAGVVIDLDAAIDRTSNDWPVSRMAGIDRSILRMAVYELMHRPEIPTTAILSEAVGLANDYSTEKSAPFINGILATLATQIRGSD